MRETNTEPPEIPKPGSKRFSRLPDPLFGFLVLYGILLAAFCCYLQGRGRVDFPSYFYAAHVTFVDRGDPYLGEAFETLSREIGQKILPFIYPPPSLLAFAPLAYLSYPAAKGTFTAVSAAAYLASIWLLLTQLTPFPESHTRRRIAMVIAAGYLAVYHASIDSLRIGQVNHLVLLFLCLTLVAMRARNAPWRTALPLSIAILLKTYPALLLVPLLLRRRYSEIILTCLFYGVIAFSAAAVLPHALWTSWLFNVVPGGAYGTVSVFADPGNQNINAFVNRLFLPNPFCDAMLSNPQLAKPIATALALLAFAITVLTAVRYHRRQKSDVGKDDEIACFLLLIFLVAPLSWNNHLMLILPAALLAISAVVAGNLRPAIAVSVTIALLLLAKGINFANPAIARGWWTLLISIKFYAVVLLWAFFVSRLYLAAEPELRLAK